MKTILILFHIALFSTNLVLAKPGGTYTLTGEEKGVPEIIKADMEKNPDLYKGESLKSYIAKFKKENQIGQRKLAPGDQLKFPDTKASIDAKKVAQKQRLIGRWEPTDNMRIEYKEDGSCSMDFMDGKIIYSGVWEIKDDYLRTKIEKSNFKGKAPSKKWVSHKIIRLTESELETQVDGQDTMISRRVK